MTTAFKTIAFFSLIILAFSTNAQRITEIGLTGGGIRFYPEAQHLGSSLNNRMDNGWGWSAGVFFEDHWKSKIHQVVELNYYNLSGDVFLQKNPLGPGGQGGEQPVYGNFDNTSFNHLAVSGGIKYFFTPKLFAYPEIGVAPTPGYTGWFQDDYIGTTRSTVKVHYISKLYYSTQAFYKDFALRDFRVTFWSSGILEENKISVDL
jgi:hypothetical protein